MLIIRHLTHNAAKEKKRRASHMRVPEDVVPDVLGRACEAEPGSSI